MASSKSERLAGLSGGSALECALLCAVCPAGLALRRALSRRGAPHGGQVGLLLDVVTLSLPPLATMLAPGRALQLLLALVSATLALSRQTPRRTQLQAPAALASTAPYVAAYRASVLLGTCAAILAVDFQAFPLRLAKTHASGTSLMDLGSGSFICVHGLVSRDARGRGAVPGVASRVRQAVRGAAPLLALGIGRLVSTRASGYEVPLDEYGAHWNFFFTIAAVRAAAAALLPLRAGGVLGALCACLAVLAAHEAALRRGGIYAALASTSRAADWASQNREGLASLPGYFAIHLGGVAIGRALSAPDASTARKGSSQRRSLLAAAACIAACAVAFRVVGPASRRAANAPYALWVLAHNAALLAASAVADAAMPGRVPLLVERLSAKHAMLGTFLVANLMTGAVNLGMDTLAVSNAAAATGLACYMWAVSAAAILLGAAAGGPTTKVKAGG